MNAARRVESDSALEVVTARRRPTKRVTSRNVGVCDFRTKSATLDAVRKTVIGRAGESGATARRRVAVMGIGRDLGVVAIRARGAAEAAASVLVWTDGHATRSLVLWVSR